MSEWEKAYEEWRNKDGKKLKGGPYGNTPEEINRMFIDSFFLAFQAGYEAGVKSKEEVIKNLRNEITEMENMITPYGDEQQE